MTAKRRTKTTAKPKAGAGRAEPEDLRDGFRDLRDAIVRELGRAPGRDSRQTALHDAWRIALKDRVPRLRRRLEDLLQARRWIVDDEDRANALQPSHWRHVLRHGLPDVAVGLAGAHRQYEGIGVRWRERMRLGAVRGRNVPPSGTKALEKQKQEAEKTLAARRARERAAYREALERVLDGWAEKREQLAGHLAELQRLAARLQAAEEDRLERLLGRAPPEVARKAKAPLAAAREQRLDAETLLLDQPKEAGRWGSLLRRWNLYRTRAAKVLA